MITITATEANDSLPNLWQQAADEPVMVLNNGQAVAVVLSPTEFARLTARRQGAKAGFAKHLFAEVDMNALLDTRLDDVFEDYQ